jgi:hypothetical protein
MRLMFLRCESKNQKKIEVNQKRDGFNTYQNNLTLKPLLINALLVYTIP